MTDQTVQSLSHMHHDDPVTTPASRSASVGSGHAPIRLTTSKSADTSPKLSQSQILNQGPSRLPFIPTLPPIQIPRNSLHPSPASAPDDGIGIGKTSGTARSDDLQPSSTRSDESYATACTSSPADPVPPDSASTAFAIRSGYGQSSTPPNFSLEQQTASGTGTLRTLPKSLSVDSFHPEQRHQRDGIMLDNGGDSVVRSNSPGPKIYTRLTATNTSVGRPATSSGVSISESTAPPLLPPLPATSTPSASTSRISVPSGIREFAARVRRRSRHGGSFAEEEGGELPLDNSEFEQGRSSSVGPSFGTNVTTVHVAAESNETQTPMPTPARRRLVPPKRSGSMPSSRSPVANSAARNRKGTVGAHPTLPSINTAIAIARTQTPSDSHSLRTKASTPTPLDTTRSRSHSVGAQSDDSAYKRSKMQISTSADVDRPPKDAISMTLAVIGSQGCGKSAFIRRAWKFFRVSDPESRTVTNGDHRHMNYSVREAYMEAYEGRDYHLTLLEIGIQELLHADGELHGDAWPACLPHVDGIFVLYDASNRSSFIHIEELIRHYYALRIPYIVLACKSDLEHLLHPQDAVHTVYKYDGGIVEISNNDVGKDKARRCVGVLLRGIQRQRYGDIRAHANPCSPGLYNVPTPWEAQPSPLSATTAVDSAPAGESAPTSATLASASGYPTSDIPNSSPRPVAHPHISHRDRSDTSTDVTCLPPAPALSLSKTSPGASGIGNDAHQHSIRSPSAPTSPTRARSMSELASAQHALYPKQTQSVDQELSRSRSIVELGRNLEKSDESVKSPAPEGSTEPISLFPTQREQRHPPLPPYFTVDELLDKLFFVAVSGDDTSFITHFLLTYRRFTTPRKILLAMQKRMIELNQPSTDPILAAFAQLQICSLLERWIHEYPNDFDVRGTAGALNAIIRQILRQTHTLYYGSDFLLFEDTLPSLHDQEREWAWHAEAPIAESDESDDNFGSDGSSENVAPGTSPRKHEDETLPVGTQQTLTRGRKSSIPLSTKFLQGSLQGTVRTQGGHQLSSNSRLTKVSNAMLHLNETDIAMEITRRELDLYLKIEPRDWLRHTLVPGKKDPSQDRISRFNAHFNMLHDWAASVILCHDKARSRAQVIEKLTKVAGKLRELNNYSALRAIITAITASTYPNDEVMDIFKRGEQHKKYLSLDILMRTSGAHQSYRLALRNTVGPCIPCLEIHTSDLRRAHVNNPDFKPGDNSQIHWAKFNMLGKFVDVLTQIQKRCRGEASYQFPERPQVGQLFDVQVMDYETQKERVGPQPEEDFDPYQVVPGPTAVSNERLKKRLFVFFSSSSSS